MAASPYVKVVPSHRHSYGVPRMFLGKKRKWKPQPVRKWIPKDESAKISA